MAWLNWFGLQVITFMYKIPCPLYGGVCHHPWANTSSRKHWRLSPVSGPTTATTALESITACADTPTGRHFGCLSWQNRKKYHQDILISMLGCNLNEDIRYLCNNIQKVIVSCSYSHVIYKVPGSLIRCLWRNSKQWKQWRLSKLPNIHNRHFTGLLTYICI